MIVPAGAVYAVAGLLILLCGLVLVLMLWPPRSPRATGGGGLAALYSYVKGRWPYILGVTSAAVVELHAQGVITDSQFKTLLALHAAGIGPALRGAIQHIVGDAIQKKVTVQIEQAKTGLPPIIPPPMPVELAGRIVSMEPPTGVPKEGI